MLYNRRNQNMEEEMRQGMMGADVQATPEPAPAPQSRFVEVIGDRVENNLENLSNEEMQLITQLNIPPFRDFMSKVFGPEFGIVMEQRVPQPQVSQPSESPAPTQGQGMMTQPPSQ